MKTIAIFLVILVGMIWLADPSTPAWLLLVVPAGMLALALTKKKA